METHTTSIQNNNNKIQLACSILGNLYLKIPDSSEIILNYLKLKIHKFNSAYWDKPDNLQR